MVSAGPSPAVARRRASSSSLLRRRRSHRSRASSSQSHGVLLATESSLMTPPQIASLTSAPHARRFWTSRALRHPFFAWAGLRPPSPAHSGEHQVLENFARPHQHCRDGVAEERPRCAPHRHGSAGTCISSTHSIFPESQPEFLRALPTARFRRPGHKPSDRDFSQNAVRQWTAHRFSSDRRRHRESAVEQDWNDWSPHLVDHGLVAFHDAVFFTMAGLPTAMAPSASSTASFATIPLHLDHPPRSDSLV